MRAANFQLQTENLNYLDYTRNYYLTRLFNSLSILFPKGERHFMEAIRHYEKQLTPALLTEAKLFYKEESAHSIQHRLLNDLLKEAGYDIDGLELSIKRKLSVLGNNPENALMITVALEIFTAYGADLLIAIDPLIFKDNEGCALWRYHAKEEANEGHRSIAMKVLKHVNPHYSRIKLVFIFILSMILLISQTVECYSELSKY